MYKNRGRGFRSTTGFRTNRNGGGGGGGGGGGDLSIR